jgi:exonuclease III
VFQMRGTFWNSNGFKDPKKHKFISDLTKENDLDFIALSEMRRTDFSPRFLKKMCLRRDYLWHSKVPRGRSGGMLLGVNLQFFDIGAIEEVTFILN